jgi:hypothetical protein
MDSPKGNRRPPADIYILGVHAGGDIPPEEYSPIPRFKILEEDVELRMIIFTDFQKARVRRDLDSTGGHLPHSLVNHKGRERNFNTLDEYFNILVYNVCSVKVNYLAIIGFRRIISTLISSDGNRREIS